MSLGDQKPSKETLVRKQSKDDHLHSKCDLVDEEEGSYGNSIYAEYYGVKHILGIDREEWDNR